MKTRLYRYALVCLSLLLLCHAQAATFYVNVSSTNSTLPYSDWSTAATNIQEAIDAATNGDLILVTNGVYQTGGRVMVADSGLTNRVALYKPLTVESVNGPWATTILGANAGNGPSAVRCAWLTNNATLSGFTLQWGGTATSGDISGGGAHCASSNSLVANCVIRWNSAYEYGGGVYQGTLVNCLIFSNNISTGLGGGIANGSLKNCTVTSNANVGVFVQLGSQGSATNCIIYFNAGGNSMGLGGGSLTLSHCCTTPLPSGDGNFSGNPALFADGVHLSASSPCIGAGTNISIGTDIFGNGWSNPPSVGCAEWQPSPIATPPQITLIDCPAGFSIGREAIDGLTPFAFWWLLNGAPLQDNGHFSFTQTSNLLATGISLADAGAYQLVVSNSFGVVTSTVAPLTVHCVSAAGTNPVPPYVTWSTAATNIQDAINAASAEDVVLVTNGVYASGGLVMEGDLTNRVAINNDIIVMSVNGFQNTVIQGAWDPITTNGPGAVRCAWVGNGGGLIGFTLENGATEATGDGTLESGGGVWLNAEQNSPTGMVCNCEITNNSAVFGGGLACMGASFPNTFGNGLLLNSLVTGNYASSAGGGAYGGYLQNCTVNFNNLPDNDPAGDGVFESTCVNCILVDNGFPEDDTDESGLSYCCSGFPEPSSGNIDADPELLDAYHISSLSPCRGAGNATNSAGYDLDGEPWNNPPSMGCSEVVVSNLLGPLSVGLNVNWFGAPTNELLVSPPGYYNLHQAFFQGITTGHVAYIAWSFGDGPVLTNTGARVYHDWTNAGDYTVSFTAYNDDNPEGVSTNIVVSVEPPQNPELLSTGLLTNGFQFQFAGQATANYTIQYANNLAPTVIWTALQTIYNSSGGLIQFTDTSPTNESRFYRVVAQ